MGSTNLLEYVDFEKLGKNIQDTEYSIVRSKKYQDTENITVLYPTSDLTELESLMSKFDSMPHGQRLRSDDYCKQIWGVTNQEMYNDCIAYINNIENSNRVDMLRSINRNKRIDGYEDKQFRQSSDIKLEDFITPIGKYLFPITEAAATSISRDDQLQKLLFSYDKIQDKTSEQAKLLEQNILSLGWIPGIPYNIETRLRAGLLQEKTKYDIVDKTNDTITVALTNVKDDFLKPVYIVLVEGTSAFSAAIKAYTKGTFTHAAICIDDSFEKLYSFNLHHSEGKGGGGFSIESVKGYDKNSKLGVFAIFVKDKDYHTIQNLLEMYEKKAKDTSYSILNVLMLPLNKSLKMDFSMICSEFVDNILKMTNIELVDKESPLVTPNDFYKASKQNAKIFKLYEGKVKNFLPKTIKTRVSRVKKEYIKEMALIEADFPIQFSDEGDLLIKNMKKLNYDEEIAKSNRLLKIYYKEDNRDGIKYELAKLWFISNLIMNDIDNEKGDKIKLTKSKATCINVFDTYIKLLFEREKGFNFTQYYESTPFSDATIRVKRNTIKYTMETLKLLLM